MGKNQFLNICCDPGDDLKKKKKKKEDKIRCKIFANRQPEDRQTDRQQNTKTNK